MATEVSKDGMKALPADTRANPAVPFKAITAAVAAALSAAGGECGCQPCRILRSAAPELAGLIYPMPDPEVKGE